jgi:hypothetical protein
MAKKHATSCVDCGAIRKSMRPRCRICAWKLRQKPTCGSCGKRRPPGKTCPACATARKREYKLRNPAKVKDGNAARKKRRWVEGAEARALKRSARRATVRERRRIARRKWKSENPGAVNAHTAKRYAAKIQAIPAWANEFFIEEAYVLAQHRTEATGVKYVVDHQIPLQSPFVCGLHTHGNLRVITARENESKNNKRWPDMWAPPAQLRASVAASPIRYVRPRRVATKAAA